MIRGIPLLWEIISLLLGLPTIAAILNFVINPPYRLKIKHDTGGKITVRIDRALRFACSTIGENLDPNKDEFEEDLNEAVSKAESRRTALNATRRSIIPRRKSLVQRLIN